MPQGNEMNLFPKHLMRLQPGNRFSLLALWAAAMFLTQAIAAEKEPLVIVQNGKYGYIDHSGKMLIRPQFFWADNFSHGLARGYVCGRDVSINLSGEPGPLRPAAPGQLEPSYNETTDKYGFIDSSGAFKIAPTFDSVLPFSGGYAAVRIGTRWGFINKAGRMVIRPQFEEAYYFDEGVGYAKLNSEDVFINTSGEIVARGYYLIDTIALGRIPVCKNKCGFLDLRGKIVVPLMYNQVMNFSEGLAAVEDHGQWGYLNRNGKIKIPLNFDYAGPFMNGLAPVIAGNTSGFINKSGEFRFYLSFRHATGFFWDDVARFWTDDDKFGLVNTSGKIIWGPVSESPDHKPLALWIGPLSKELVDQSCEGIPEDVRKRIADFPE